MPRALLLKKPIIDLAILDCKNAIFCRPHCLATFYASSCGHENHMSLISNTRRRNTIELFQSLIWVRFELDISRSIRLHHHKMRYLHLLSSILSKPIRPFVTSPRNPPKQYFNILSLKHPYQTQKRLSQILILDILPPFRRVIKSFLFFFFLLFNPLYNIYCNTFRVYNNNEISPASVAVGISICELECSNHGA